MEPHSSRGRYDVSGNVEAQFVDAAETVLVNKQGITDLLTLQALEERALARAYELLFNEVRIDTPVTCDLLLHIHKTIFGDLFEWAGRWRTLNISKPGAIWPAAQFLEFSMAEFETTVLRKYRAGILIDDAAFCRAIGEIQGEFLAVHPFREGNARTIKLATDILSVQTGRPLLVYDQTHDGAQNYIAAASAALLRKDYQPLTEVIAVALRAAR